MDIQGPLKIHVLNEPDTAGWQLLLKFSADFIATEQAAQGAIFATYVTELGQTIGSTDEADPNRAGMLIVHQISEQLQSYVQSGELDLNESVIIQIEQAQAVSITDLLKS